MVNKNRMSTSSIFSGLEERANSSALIAASEVNYKIPVSHTIPDHPVEKKAPLVDMDRPRARNISSLPHVGIHLERNSVDQLNTWSRDITALREMAGQRITTSSIIGCLVSILIENKDNLDLHNIESEEQLRLRIQKALGLLIS